MTKRTNIKSERGQTMVEFALVAPVLLMVLFGIIQFGLTFNNYLTLTDAVRAGARAAAVSRLSVTPAADTISKVKNSAANLDQSRMNVTVTASWAQGSDVVVKATYPYSISLLGMVIASGDLSSQTTERVE